ncbi:MAG: hypothetical protein V1836_01060, partial [Candidatus Aenigmatarchaeota archaeon]
MADDPLQKEKLCPKCGTDIVMTTRWDGKLEPMSNKCIKCGYEFEKRGWKQKIRNFFTPRWSGT